MPRVVQSPWKSPEGRGCTALTHGGGSALEGQAGIPTAPRGPLGQDAPNTQACGLPAGPHGPHLHSLEEMKGTANAPVFPLGGKISSVYFIVLVVLFVCIPGKRWRFILALVRRGYNRRMQGTQPSFKVGYLGVAPGKCSPGGVDTAHMERG